MAGRILHTIVAGPSREELFDALRLRHEGRKVKFTIGDEGIGPVLDVIVNRLEIEDGSGNNWQLKIYDPRKTYGSEYLEGYFSTTRRAGWFWNR